MGETQTELCQSFVLRLCATGSVSVFLARFLDHGSVDKDLPKLTRPDPSWFDRSGVKAEHR
jgi:hypothetical protein